MGEFTARQSALTIPRDGRLCTLSSFHPSIQCSSKLTSRSRYKLLLATLPSNKRLRSTKAVQAKCQAASPAGLPACRSAGRRLTRQGSARQVPEHQQKKLGNEHDACSSNLIKKVERTLPHQVPTQACRSRTSKGQTNSK